MLPTAVALTGSLWLGFSPAHTIGTVVLAFTYSMYSTLRGIQYGALRFRHVAVWDTIAGGVALVAVTVVLTLDLTAFALLPLALGYALFAVVSWPARVSGRVDAALRRQIDHFVHVRCRQRARERRPAPALAARGARVRRARRGRRLRGGADPGDAGVDALPGPGDGARAAAGRGGGPG